jgi:hypothetical protein
MNFYGGNYPRDERRSRPFDPAELNRRGSDRL